MDEDDLAINQPGTRPDGRTMTDTGHTGCRILGRLSGLVWCMLVLAGLGTIIGFVVPASDDGEGPTAEEERPFAQTACIANGSPIASLAFSTDDARLASATMSGEVRLGDLRGGTWDLVGRGPMSSAQSLAFSPDGRALAVAGLGPIVSLLDAESGEERRPLTLERGNNAMHVAFSRDGKYLASGGFGGELTLWEWAGRRRLAAPRSATRVSPRWPSRRTARRSRRATRRDMSGCGTWIPARSGRPSGPTRSAMASRPSRSRPTAPNS